MNAMQMISRMIDGRNPIQLFGILMNSSNPMGVLNQMLGGDPMFQQAVRMAQGKNGDEIRKTAQNIAQQKGLDLNSIEGALNKFGIRLPK